jgi:endonuclease/exonuclease/phosphatase family metal-dependent hydrolase
MKANPRLAWLAFPLFLLIATAYGIWFSQVETPPWHNKKDIEQSPLKATAKPIHKEHPAEFRAFTFVSYNVKNWLSCPQTPEKSQASKTALISLIAKAKPDIIGLSEIGSQKDVAEIQAMLRASGLDFPHHHYTGGVDPVRHLAIISRYPLQAIAQPDIRLASTEQSMQRGILDATISIGSQSIRFIGLHLKSKRIVSDFDEAQLRLSEANQARRYIDGILTQKPDTMLLVYGDWNDDPRSLSTRTLLGNFRTPLYLTPIPVKDSRGENWTFHHQIQDSYNRIDYVAYSEKLKRFIKKDRSRILDDPLWHLASDHRALLISFE